MSVDSNSWATRSCSWSQQPDGEGFIGNAEAVLERGLAGLGGVGQHGGVHVDDDLVPLAARAGIEPVREGRLRHQGEGVGLLLAVARRLALAGLRRCGPTSSMERLARRLERPHEQRPRLRLQPAAHDDHPVLVRVHLERPALMTRRRLLRLDLPVHLPPRPHDALHVGRRPRPPDGQEPRFGLRSRDSRERADLRVGQLPPGQGGGELGQFAQRPRHADPFPGRPRVEAHAPAEPLCAGAAAVGPAPARVELADQGEEPGGGGVEVSREHGDLVTEPVEVGRGRGHGRRREVHGVPPASDSTTRIASHPGGRGLADRHEGNGFWLNAGGAPCHGPARPAGRD